MLGLSFDDLYDITPRSFQNKLRGFRSHTEQLHQNSWEQTRMIIHSCISPHSKQKLKAKDLLPFPWDNDKKNKPVIPTKEELKDILAIREEQFKRMKFNGK